MVDDRCPRCDDYDEVVEELKKEKDSRERGAKDALHKCEEKNKTRDKKIKGLEKKILTMTIAAVGGGTIVGKDVLDKIAEYIQSFNSIKDTATKLISTLPNEPPEEKNDEEVEEVEYTRTLTLAPRKIDTSAWPGAMSISSMNSYQNQMTMNYGLPLSSFFNDSFDTVPTITQIILEDILDDLVIDEYIPSGISIPEIEMDFPINAPISYSAVSFTTVPESNAWVLLAGIPIIYYRKRRK